jgi:GNAT superfamily N-acetyltransferase
MELQIHIFQASSRDAQAISELIGRTAHTVSVGGLDGLAPWFLASITPAAIAGYIADPRISCQVAVKGESLVGVIALRDTSHVHHLFVNPSFHRQGIAAMLWEQAQVCAIKAGNTQGFTVRSSVYAVPVYERFGFRQSGDHAEKDGIAFVPMRLDL